MSSAEATSASGKEGSVRSPATALIALAVVTQRPLRLGQDRFVQIVHQHRRAGICELYGDGAADAAAGAGDQRSLAF